VNQLDSIIQTGMSNLLERLSLFIFKIVREVLSGIEHIVTNQSLFVFSETLLMVGILIVLLLIVKRVLYFMNGNQYQIKGYIKENKNRFFHIFILLFICLFPSQILQFTFHFWDDFMNEREIFHQIENVKDTIEGNSLTSMIMIMTTSLSALFIVLVQVIEVMALMLILFLSPLMLIVSIFKPKLFDFFIRAITEAVINPISQTLIMYVSFTMIVPAFSVEQSLSPLFQSLMILGMIFFSYQGAKTINSLFFVREEEKSILSSI
jgi:hypothetical protein